MAAPHKLALLVDDDPTLLGIFARIVQQAGYAVSTATGGEDALAKLQSGPVDVIVTDLAMPGMSGLELVKRVRLRDPDLPIIILTGAPGFESAVSSIDFGVFRYVMKPIEPPELVRAISDAVHARALAQARKAAYAQTRDEAPDHAALERALDSMWLAVQPIVAPVRQRVFAYEALLRTRDSQLRDPHAVFTAAERLGALGLVGRAVRARAAELLPKMSPDGLLFVNLHPYDLLDTSLYQHGEELSRSAQRVVLEITERSSLEDIPDVRARILSLKSLGYRIALDDMSAKRLDGAVIQYDEEEDGFLLDHPDAVTAVWCG